MVTNILIAQFAGISRNANFREPLEFALFAMRAAISEAMDAGRRMRTANDR
jgi:hypothetical protein